MISKSRSLEDASYALVHIYEDTKHLFIDCNHVKEITRQINTKMMQILQQINTNLQSPRIIIQELRQRLTIEEFTELATIWWAIWHQRNKLVFQQESNDIILDLANYIKTQIHIWG